MEAASHPTEAAFAFSGDVGWPRPIDLRVMGGLHLDLRGLKCPLPALRTRKALARARSGDVVTVECTDPLATVDVPNAAREAGAVLDGWERRGDVLLFRLRKTS